MLHTANQSDVSSIFGLSKADAVEVLEKLSKSEVTNLLAELGYELPLMFVISCLQLKGGTGKTTTTRMLAEILASLGAMVVVLDLDSTANLTKAFGVDAPDRYFADMIRKNSKVRISDHLIKIRPNLYFLPSGEDNAALDTTLGMVNNPPRAMLEKLYGDLKDMAPNFILIDCQPTYGNLNKGILGASDLVVAPMEPCEFSYAAMSKLKAEAESVQADFNLSQTIQIRLLLTKTNERENSTKTLRAKLQDTEVCKAFKTVIRQTSDYRNSLFKGVSPLESSGKPRDDYHSLVKEILDTFFLVKH